MRKVLVTTLALTVLAFASISTAFADGPNLRISDTTITDDTTRSVVGRAGQTTASD